MRIISGTLKGRRLFAPKSQNTRPTSDRIRESLFSILGEKVIDGEILDLFAGTGALGIEALSRQAKHCSFAEPDKSALKTLQKNLEFVTKAQYTLFKTSALHTLKRLNRQAKTFDIVFLDPPYEGSHAEEIWAWMRQNTLLNPEGLVVYEHSAKKTLENNYFNLRCKESRIFGDTALSFFME
ncbi:MAG: 16S rRNA (guanine(966)-N(2))-methyltransferase RsmD [Myxococcota bacterium]|nr:16S rRNA (guanine(966)-N(2))-methyltransferase RsmD [Myxococcota bacterium]